MKFTLRYIFLLLVAFTFGCKSTKKAADHSTTVESKTLAYQKLDNALLWSIEGNGLTQPSYLFGTIHMIDAEDYFLPGGTESALESAKEVVFEIDMSKMNNIATQFSLMGKIMMKDGVTLKDLLTAEEYTEVDQFFSAKGMPMMFMQRIKPMFLSAMTEIDMGSFDLKGGGLNTEDAGIKSYEMEFNSMAEANEIPVDGLETINYQIEIFDKIPYEAQAKMLLEAVRGSKSGENSQMEELVKAYKQQNIEALVQSIDDSEEYAEFEDMLLNDRNANWIPIMAKKMAKQTTFFAVGAGHLAGPKGVIHLLKNEGYTLTPILKPSMNKI